jgi:hypothetical protein
MPKGGKSMTSPKGLYSYKNNPMKAAKQTRGGTGPALCSPANPDQMKVGKLQRKAYAEKESLRGANGI